jgi:HD-like signal output (HDOD) protein
MFDFFRGKTKDPKEELKKLIGSYELPSFSMTIMNILTSLRDSDYSTEKLAEQLEVDPGLHVKILKVVNSAAFGFSTEVKNLRHAIALLGKSRLETIVLSQAVNDTLPSVEYPFFNMSDFWLCSARRASLARTLAQQLHPSTQSEAFSVGLLQDMALPVLVKTYPEEYEKIITRWKGNSLVPLHTIEREFFEFDHFFAGGLMALEWGLPDHLTSAISRHDSSEIDQAVNLLAYLSLDDVDHIKDTLCKSCLQKSELEEDAIMLLIDEALVAATELSSMLR